MKLEFYDVTFYLQNFDISDKVSKLLVIEC